ncbi:hypothetical protein LZ32DRAFT_540900 [Colletotrichum eremochloae]|nr:hypothetical protein LZ32DRAFT_540900 [Colletotrichum eremochloae]
MLKHTVHLLQEAVAELRMINQNLKGIKDELGAHNTLISMGGASPDGFAPVVHGFVYLHIQKNHSGDGGCQKNGHMFFVWHPDNTWHWRFEQLLKEKPLPAAFCAYSDDLDSLCALMKEVRRMLPNGSSPVVFHLLIPAWYKIDVKEPLHFPDELQPLRIAGMRHSGKPLVSFNLPAAQENLLDGVANVLDPEGHNMRAEIAGAATFLVGGGWGTNGVCLATGVFLGGITGLGALVAIPVWCGGFMSVGAPAAAYAAQTIHGALRENAPRIIGSDDRLARRSC